MDQKSLKEMEQMEVQLLKSISRFDQGIATVRKNISKFKSCRKRVKASIAAHGVRLENSKLDIIEVQERSEIIRLKLLELDKSMESKSSEFYNEMSSLEELKAKIERHTNQVLDNVLKINESSNEWEFANKLTTRVCDVSKLSAYNAFQRWLLLWPALQVWMSSDAYAVSTVYSVAFLEGLSSEIMAHLEAKKNIQKFSEQFKSYSDADLKANYAQVVADQKMRSANLDQMHAALVKRCVSLLRSCESLKQEVEGRELFRQALSRQLLDLSACLEEDLQRGLAVAERQATKPLAAATQQLRAQQRQEEEQLRQDGHTGGRFTAPLRAEQLLDPAIRTASIATPLQTLKNTAQNSQVPPGESIPAGFRSLSEDRVAAHVSRFDHRHPRGKGACWQWTQWHSLHTAHSLLRFLPHHLPLLTHRPDSRAGECSHELAAVRALTQYPLGANPADDSEAEQLGLDLSAPLQQVLAAARRGPMPEAGPAPDKKDKVVIPRSPLLSISPRPPPTSHRGGPRRAPPHTPSQPPAAEAAALTAVVTASEGSGGLRGVAVSGGDVAQLCGLGSRQVLSGLQRTCALVTHTTVREISGILQQSQQKPSVDLQAQQLHSQLAQQLSACRDPFDSWIVAALAAKYQDTCGTLASLTQLLPAAKATPAARPPRSLSDSEEGAGELRQFLRDQMGDLTYTTLAGQTRLITPTYGLSRQETHLWQLAAGGAQRAGAVAGAGAGHPEGPGPLLGRVRVRAGRRDTEAPLARAAAALQTQPAGGGGL